MCYKNTQIISGGCQVTAPARVNTLRHHITYMSIILCEMTRLPRKIFFFAGIMSYLDRREKKKKKKKKKKQSHGALELLAHQTSCYTIIHIR